MRSTPTTPAAAPVRVEAAARSVRVVAVVPCFNRQPDLDLLGGDLATCALSFDRAGETVAIELSVLVVDNASEPPLTGPTLPHAIASRVLRLAANTGGSGGYNAGLAFALEDDPDYIWMVDSDARVRPDTLSRLLGAMERDTSIVALGPALADVATGEVMEVGGRLDRRTGRFGPAEPAATGDEPATCDYVAACCALVRADAIHRVGLMPDVFLNADDVEWCLRLARETGGRVAVLPSARASHPRFDRFAAMPRYFGARNAFGPIDALGLGRAVRCKRAMRESLRAVNQHLMGRPDLAALHMRGLRDAARRRTSGLPDDLPRIEPVSPPEALAALLPTPAGTLAIDWPADCPADERAAYVEALRLQGYEPDDARRAPTRSLAALARRVVTGPRLDVALVPAKGSPAHWLLARTMIEIAPGGFVLRRTKRFLFLARAAGAVGLGLVRAAQIAARRATPSVLPTGEETVALAPAPRDTSLSIVVLSYNRADALLETLGRLRTHAADAEVIVVDNGSSDGTVEAVRDAAPLAKVMALETNEAIAGFNRGVEAAAGEVVLVLDDDARPDPDALAGALELLADRPDLGAVTLLPVHPKTGRTEWPFGERLQSPSDAWPVMGCCNLVRRSVWRAVGGYDAGFFLYRNDTDLAMKILSTGLGVHFNPAWRCEHDSPAAARKSPRWCRLATRNWVWLARRHGRGAGRLGGALFGWAWAHKLSGLSPSRHWATLRGGLAGVFTRPPRVARTVRPDGRAFRALLRLRFGR